MCCATMGCLVALHQVNDLAEGVVDRLSTLTADQCEAGFRASALMIVFWLARL